MAVVSNGLAKQLWDDPDHAVGKTLDAGGMSLTVIGVIEPLVDDRTDVYLPAAVWGPDGSTRSAHNWQVLARLASRGYSFRTRVRKCRRSDNASIANTRARRTP